jgi:hypothetical protein
VPLESRDGEEPGPAVQSVLLSHPCR